MPKWIFQKNSGDQQGVSLSHFSLVTAFFEGTRENILHIFRAKEVMNPTLELETLL